MDYITFPWEQLGRALRRLSLSGGMGNAAAWILFISLGALPLIAAAFLLYRRMGHRTDFLLAVLSAALFVGLWFFINPSYMDRYLSPIPTGGNAKYALAAVIDSLLLTWLLLRFLLRMETESSMAGRLPELPIGENLPGGERHFQRKLLLLLRMLLNLYALALAVSLVAEGVTEFRESLAALQENNTGSGDFLLTVSALFLALQSGIGLLPAVAQIALLLMTGLFLRCYEKEPFGPKSCLRMEQLKKNSGRLLLLLLLANVSFNVLQLLLSRFLLTSCHRILFPLREIIVMLGIRTLSFLYLESKRLKEDNDMFI